MNRIKETMLVLLVLIFSVAGASAATISGTVTFTPGFGVHNAYIAVFQAADMETPVNKIPVDTDRTFSVTVPVDPEPYVIFAFLDENANAEYEIPEPAGMYNMPLMIPSDTDYPLGTIELFTPEVILNVSDASGSFGDIITVDITTATPGAIAGGAFTVFFDETALSLTSVDTVFFDTFANQWASLSPPPSSLPPTSVDVDGQTYTQPAISNLGSGFAMLAAARVEPLGTNPSGDTVLATLTFEIIATTGSHKVTLMNSLINNTSAGYSADGEFIPMLTGSTGGPDPATAYPTIASVVGNAGTVTVASCSDDWVVYDNIPAGATITSVVDDVLGTTKCVTELSGSGTANGYKTNNPNPASSDRIIEWKMKFDETFKIYVSVQSSEGHKYIVYTPVDSDLLGIGLYAEHGLGTSSIDGTWRSFKRNLSADLENAQSGTTISTVNAFYIRGSGQICDIQLTSDTSGIDSDQDGLSDNDEMISGTDPYSADTDNDGINDGDEYAYWAANGGWDLDSDSDGTINLLELDSDGDGVADGVELLLGTNPAIQDDPNESIYEDAEDGTDKWKIYDNNPSGAIIDIENLTSGTHLGNVIKLTGDGTANGFRLRNAENEKWHNTSMFNLEWDMQITGDYIIYIDVETDLGHRYLIYTPKETNALGSSLYVEHGLGIDSNDSTWRTFKRDLTADLKHAQPTNNIVDVNGFLIRGSGFLDNIKLTKDDSDIDSDRDGLSDIDEASEGTDPYHWDTDGDGISDGDEVSGSTDPLVPNGTEIVYEDGTDTSRWRVYDATPAGATISSANGEIHLTGTGTANGYRLRNADGTKWQNDQMFVIQWSMNYSEDFKIYIDVLTDLGNRYFVYRPIDKITAGSSLYVETGLGAGVNTGTFTRDLAAELAIAQPGNNIIEVNGFLIRGSGTMDNIKLMETMP